MALDATKAFDRVNYVKLFEMLIDRNVNPYYIRILLQSYTSQKLRVQYDNKMSDWFKVTNGVKQGGVLSPTLFGVYVDGMLKEISDKRLGCNIGDMNVGIVGYADDIILLAPTLQSLYSMVSICVDYAKEYAIKFNAKKSQLIGFGCDVKDLCFYMNNEKVEIVDELKYLGSVISCKRNDPMVKTVKNDFVAKVNNFLGNFFSVSSDVKSKLFQQYCTSYYGSQSCMVYHNSFNELKISWRKAIRRVWNVPYRTHSALLPHISGQIPCEIMLYKRFVKHFMSGYNHKNASINFLFHNSLYSDGRLYKNLKFVGDFCNCKIHDLVSKSVNSVTGKIENKWRSSVYDEDVRIGVQIRELCFRRDCFNAYDEWQFDNNDIVDIINYLCTA